MSWLRSLWGRALVLATLVLLIVAGNAARAARAPRGLEVETLTVGPGEFSLDVNAPGVVEAADPVEVRAPLTARLLEVLVEPGDTVEAGQVIARYDAEDLRVQAARLEQELAQARAQLNDLEKRSAGQEELAEAQLAQAEARLRQARLDLEAVTRTTAPGDPERRRAEQRVQEAEAALAELRSRLATESVSSSELAAARAAVGAAQAALTQVRAQLADVELRAPEAGTVLAVEAESGASVSAGALIASIARLEVVEVVAEVDEIDIGRVRPGLSAEVTTLAYPDRTFSATVTRLAPAARRQEDVAVFDVRLRVDNREGLLRPGMTVDVAIHAERRSGVLVVPYAAVTVRDGRTGVFAVVDGTARFRPVETGLSTETEVIVTSGLAGGEVIVTGPPAALRVLADGQRVQPSGNAAGGSEPSPSGGAGGEGGGS